MSSAYGLVDTETRRAWSDGAVVALAVATWLGARSTPRSALGLCAVIGVASISRGVRGRGIDGVPASMSGRGRGRGLGAACAGLVVLSSCLAARAESGLRPGPAVRVEGVAELVGDPAVLGPGVSVVVRMKEQRYVIDAFGSAARRLRNLNSGALVYVVGDQAALSGNRARRLRSRHVSMELDVARVTDLQASSKASLAANRVKEVLQRGTEPMADTERALFLGLVLGDDRDQSREMIATFRTTGLSHLTAASGQNVAFLLVALGPLLRSLRPAPRWAATLVVIAWFAVLTRFEPSVIRASAMAALAATAFWRGWKASPLRLLALASIACILIDPFLVSSIGWWLSIGATTGIAVLAQPLGRRIAGPRWIAEPIAVSMAAQVGVMPVTLFVFGSAPLVSLPANLLAVPVAGFVMTWGIPAGLVAGASSWLAPVVHLPSVVATRWVLVVATLGERIEPGWPPMISAVAHLVVVGAILQRRPRAEVRRLTSASHGDPSVHR